MERPTMEAIHAAMREKDYLIFENSKGYDVNIVGIRSSSRELDAFDDWLTVSYLSPTDNAWVFHAWQATTDAGKGSVLRAVNNQGTAFMKPGQYRSSHMIRLHANKYSALCQRFGTNLPVYRLKLDAQSKPVAEESHWRPSYSPMGNGTGLNIHRANRLGSTEAVGRHSAGCQVFKNANDFEMFMTICNISKDLYGNSFTYTLLDEQDLPGGRPAQPYRVEELAGLLDQGSSAMA